MRVHLPVDHPTAAEAIAFARPFDRAGVGFVVGQRLLARAGVAAVSAVRSFGPVLADARLSGDPATVVAAARTLASGGASWITVGPGCGPRTITRVATALAERGATPVVVLVAPEVGDGDIDVVTAGVGRGRMISRLAAEVAGIDGIEILGLVSDVGVVAQVAPGLRVVVAGVGDVTTASDARTRGAAAIVLAPGAVAARDDLVPFLDPVG